MTLIAAILVVIAACVASSAFTALVSRMALRLGWSDNPDNHRKIHRGPTPFGGGVAIFGATAAVLGALWWVPNPFRDVLWEHWDGLLGLLLASAVIVTVGLVDDCLGMRVRQKLFGQILAAFIVMAGGLLIRRVGILGWEIELHLLSVPFTLFWLLGAINALNLLDGIDGLATTLGLILVGTIALMAAKMERPEVVIIAVVFAGALLGFLRFNFPPARVFLGDGGSMLIGLVVGTLAIQGSLKGPGTVLLAAPLAVWTIPVFDTAAAILRRRLRGRSIYTGDRSHIHHRLLDRLGSNLKVLGWLAASCAVTSAAALISVFLKNDLIALLTCAAVVTIFIVTGVFGRVEFLLLGRRLWRVGLSLLPGVSTRRARTSQATFRLHGSRQWDSLWQALLESAEGLQLSKIQLDVDLPAAREGCHATWERRAGDSFDRCWRLELPLVAGGHTIGHLTIFGQRNGEAAGHDVGRLLHVLERFETRLLALTEQKLPVPAAAGKPAPAGSEEQKGSPVSIEEYPAQQEHTS